MPDINVPKQSYNTIIIVLGIGLLLYDFVANPEVIYFKISGLVILMFGLYRSTKQWSSDNQSDKEENPDENLTDEN